MAMSVEDKLDALEARVDMLEVRAANGFGVTAEEVRERLGEPFVRRPETIARFRAINGSFDGPEDLSERMRDSLYGEERVDQR